jgi:hypothetical protein
MTNHQPPTSSRLGNSVLAVDWATPLRRNGGKAKQRAFWWSDDVPSLMTTGILENNLRQRAAFRIDSVLKLLPNPNRLRLFRHSRSSPSIEVWCSELIAPSHFSGGVGTELLKLTAGRIIVSP